MPYSNAITAKYEFQLKKTQPSQLINLSLLHLQAFFFSKKNLSLLHFQAALHGHPAVG
jgi:hypothetical protein